VKTLLELGVEYGQGFALGMPAPERSLRGGPTQRQASPPAPAS
jgi:EAL domain-containing protein (putative c-di-GMP-specific phosphodiesterase class I)